MSAAAVTQRSLILDQHLLDPSAAAILSVVPYLVPLMLMSVMLDGKQRSAKKNDENAGRGSPRLTVKKFMSDAVRRRVDTEPSSGGGRFKVKRKPLREKDVNMVVDVEGEDNGDESMDEEDVVQLLEKLRTDSRRIDKKRNGRNVDKSAPSPPAPIARPATRDEKSSYQPTDLLTHALSRPAPPIPVKASPAAPPLPASPPPIRRVASKYDATLPKRPSPLSSRAAPQSTTTHPVTHRLRTALPPRTRGRKSQLSHHGHSKSALTIIRALWEERYESWVFKNIGLNLTCKTSSKPAPSSPSPTAEIPNPDLFPRVGNLLALRSSPASDPHAPEGNSTGIDYYFGTCSLSSIQRTLYLFDLDQRLNANAMDVVDVDARPWEYNWEVRWRVLAAILRRNQAQQDALEAEGDVSFVDGTGGVVGKSMDEIVMQSCCDEFELEKEWFADVPESYGQLSWDDDSRMDY